MARRKIGLVGAGNIGGELANQAVAKGLGDVVLFDTPEKENHARGKALDLEQAAVLGGTDVRVIGTSSWDDLSGSDVLIVTAGFPRKPGQPRDDLLSVNLPVVRGIAESAARVCPGAFVIVVSNPLDAMVYEFQRRSGIPANRVVGMAGVLDSLRLALFAARELGVSVQDVRAMVLGGHGDDMVPVPSASSVNGVPLTDLIPRDRLDAIIARTRSGGGEIVGLMGTSAYYAPAASAITMAESHLLDQKRLLPCAAWLSGEYGYADMYLGVPVIIGSDGVEKIVELPLSSEERAAFSKSAEGVRSLIELLLRAK
jgi:malate dehydrogenase